MQEGNGDLEKKLWDAAEKMRGPVESAEYKHIVLGLLFLKYISDSFEKRRKKLEQKTRDKDSPYYCGDDKKERNHILEDKDEYYSEGVFYVPEEGRWSYLQDNATQPNIGKMIDDAMRAIEDENPDLKGILPKIYATSPAPHDTLEELINLFADLELTETRDNGEEKKDNDVFGRVYEYFIKEFAREEGHRGGEFYTPKSVVELLVEILEPYEGRIFDPFCGSGGMFVQSYKFLDRHDGNPDDIAIYGQEINEATLRICEMNLAIRNIEGDIRLGDSIRDDLHRGLNADKVITNPPFNMSEWGKDSIADDDPRFKYGMPPSNNANFAFIQHMIHHLDEDGMCGTVMANGSMSVQDSQGDIRKNIIENDLLDVVVALPKQLFYTTQIPACLWIMSKGKGSDEYRDRSEETLFIDAREIYKSIDRTQNILTDKQIKKIASTVRAYRGEKGPNEYEDVKGYCKAVTTEDIADNNYIITPGRYVGIEEDDEDDIPFEVKMEELVGELREKFKESNDLQEKIEHNLEELGF